MDYYKNKPLNHPISEIREAKIRVKIKRFLRSKGYRSNIINNFSMDTLLKLYKDLKENE